MIRVSVLYPSTEGSRFDMAYYCGTRIPMVRRRLGSACKTVDVDQGLSGVQPGSPARFAAMAHLAFDSLETFQHAFGPNAEAILGDIANDTHIEPIIQIKAARS